MEPKTSKAAPGIPTQLDAVAWVRGVRDAMYERTRTMSREDFVAYVARAAAVDREGAGTSSVPGTG